MVEKSDSGAIVRAEEYRLGDLGQNSFTDVFERLSREFGTRLPRNRISRAGSASDPRLRPLLTASLDPDRILYGYGDPWLLKVGGGYVLVVTSNDAPDSFPILTSPDLVSWRLAGFAFPNGATPEWAASESGVSDYWAPEIHRAGGRFILCFSARQHDGQLAIGLARSSVPTGPFEALPNPLISGGVIDAHLFADPGGGTYLFWKEDNNDRWPAMLCELLHRRPDLVEQLFTSPEDRRTAALYRSMWPWIDTLRPMERFFALQVLIEAVVARFGEIKRRLSRITRNEDAGSTARIKEMIGAMRTPVQGRRLDPERLTLSGNAFPVIENDLDWEGPLIEGMCMTAANGKYFLFYSGNDFSTADYGIGHAVADKVQGPYRKQPEPLLRSTAEWWGPGHPSIAPGPTGAPMLFMHAYPAGTAAYKSFRALLCARLRFVGDRAEVV